MAAQECTRAIGEEYCVLHPEEKLVRECQDCDGDLVCIECITTIHQTHKMVKINETVKNKLSNIEQFIKQTKEKSIPDVEMEIQLTMDTLRGQEVKLQSEMEKVKKQEKRLKGLVERYSRSKEERIQQLQKNMADLMNNHKTYLEKLKLKLEQDTKQCEQTIKTGTDIAVHDIETRLVKNNKHVNIPKIPAVTSSHFSPCEDPSQHIEKAFGDLIEHMVQYGQKKTAQVASGCSFLDPPMTLYESPTTYTVEYSSIHCTPNNDTWSLDINGTLHRHDNIGRECQTLAPDVTLLRICIHPTTGEMFGTHIDDKSIRQVNLQDGTTRVMFYTDGKPCTIGCPNDNHLVIATLDSHIRVYNDKGKILHTTEYTYKQAPDISVCSRTNNIALISNSDKVVAVLDPTLQKLYEYKGLATDKFHTAAFLDRYLLVGDEVNKNIRVIDKDTVVRTVSTKEMSTVNAVTVGQDGAVYVGCKFPNNLLCIKFMD